MVDVEPIFIESVSSYPSGNQSGQSGNLANSPETALPAYTLVRKPENTSPERFLMKQQVGLLISFKCSPEPVRNLRNSQSGTSPEDLGRKS